MEESIECDEVVRKPRVSLFNRTITVSNEPIPKQDYELEYLKDIENNKKEWKKLYEDEKLRKKALIKMLEPADMLETIDIDVLLKDDPKPRYNRAFANITRTAEDLENLVRCIIQQNTRHTTKKKKLVKQFLRATNYVKTNDLK